MKKTKKLIETVVTEVAGIEALSVVKILLKKNSVSEYDIADRIHKDINQTRNLLYELHKSNLVYSIRKKDKVKGWYIYYWTFDVERISHLYGKMQEKKIEQLKKMLEREDGKSFFVCINKCMRIDFEQAMSYSFKCPECGSLMDRDDNLKKVIQIKKQIEELEKNIKKK
ncbi:MAG: hypothetical protein NTV63_03665 [Candidatus Woesearchaeota archaeon]|nr:hypothetical protein [Candidatus Woesearchaeota archaeon]